MPNSLLEEERFSFQPLGRIQQQLQSTLLESDLLVRKCVPEEDMKCNWKVEEIMTKLVTII